MALLPARHLRSAFGFYRPVPSVVFLISCSVTRLFLLCARVHFAHPTAVLSFSAENLQTAPKVRFSCLDLRSGGCLIREQGNLGSVPATAPLGRVQVLLEIQSRQLIIVVSFC
jgi:hypothetical protein